MLRGEEWKAAAAVTAVAAGPGFASGRALSAFFAQTGKASWAGVVLAAVLFAIFTAGIAALGRRTGAANPFQLLCRLPVNGFVRLLYGLLLACAAWMAVQEAGHIGALALPVHHASLAAGLLAVLLALALVLSGKRVFAGAARCFLGALLAFEIALLLWGKLPPEPRFNFRLELKLQGNLAAACGFALLYASVSACISAGVILHMSSGGIRPKRLGLFAGVMLLAVLTAGNAVLQWGEREMMALQLPFAALGGGWGKAGFYISTGLIFAASAVELAGVLLAVLI